MHRRHRISKRSQKVDKTANSSAVKKVKCSKSNENTSHSLHDDDEDREQQQYDEEQYDDEQYDEEQYDDEQYDDEQYDEDTELAIAISLSTIDGASVECNGSTNNTIEDGDENEGIGDDVQQMIYSTTKNEEKQKDTSTSPTYDNKMMTKKSNKQNSLQSPTSKIPTKLQKVSSSHIDSCDRSMNRKTHHNIEDDVQFDTSNLNTSTRQTRSSVRKTEMLKCSTPSNIDHDVDDSSDVTSFEDSDFDMTNGSAVSSDSSESDEVLIETNKSKHLKRSSTKTKSNKYYIKSNSNKNVRHHIEGDDTSNTSKNKRKNMKKRNVGDVEHLKEMKKQTKALSDDAKQYIWNALVTPSNINNTNNISCNNKRTIDIQDTPSLTFERLKFCLNACTIDVDEEDIKAMLNYCNSRDNYNRNNLMFDEFCKIFDDVGLKIGPTGRAW